MRHIRVAVPVPALEALTYRLPDISIDPVVGARVLVPLGKRIVTGVVTGPTVVEAEDDGIKMVVDVLDGEAFLPAEIVSLALWVADYYACGAGEAIGAAMPPRAWIESERHARITDAGHARMLLERGARREILEQLASEKPLRVDTLIGEGRGTHGAVLGLERDGLLTITRPLVGSASAFRTVRVAHLTAQGHEVVPADRRRADPPARRRADQLTRRPADAPTRRPAVNRKRSGCWPRHRTESTAPSSAGEGSRPPS